MNCYEHQSVSAVAICKVCSKGLCPNCVHIEPFAMTCQTCAEKFRATKEWEQHLREYNQQVIDNRVNPNQLIKNSRLLQVVVFLLTGLASFVYGLYTAYFTDIPETAKSELSVLYYGIAALFLTLAAFTTWLTKQNNKSSKP